MELLPNTHNLIKTVLEDHLDCVFSDDFKGIGFSVNGEFGAGFAWHDMRYDRNNACISVAFSLVIEKPKAINKTAIALFFTYPFMVLKAKRLWALIDVNNEKSNSFALKIGATLEGVARQSLENGNDAHVWSITKDDLTHNKWWQKWVAKAAAQQSINLNQ